MLLEGGLAPPAAVNLLLAQTSQAKNPKQSLRRHLHRHQRFDLLDQITERSTRCLVCGGPLPPYATMGRFYCSPQCRNFRNKAADEAYAKFEKEAPDRGNKAYPSGQPMWSPPEPTPCADDPEAWFPLTTRTNAAKAAAELCRYCPSSTECLTVARRYTDAGEHVHGIWGGHVYTGKGWEPLWAETRD